MLRMRYAVLVAAVLAISPWGGLHAHGPDAGTAAAATDGGELELSIRLDPADVVPPVVHVPLGAQVQLSVTGAGEAELHLHGYDVEASGAAGPAILVFHATHEGRFPVEAHVEDDLLGERSRPVLFVEVRAP